MLRAVQKNLTHSARLFAVLAFCLCLGSAHARAQQTPAPIDELRVSVFTNYLPFAGVSLAGKPSGLLVDIWNLWSQKSGVPIRFVSHDTFAKSIEALRDGTADVHAGLFRSKEREEWLDFSRSLFEFTSTMYTWSERNSTPTLAALSGKPVGVLDGTYQLSFLNESRLGIIPRAFDTPEDMLSALARGDVDAVFHEDVAMTSLLQRLGIAGEIKRLPIDLIRNTTLPATRKDRPDIRAVIDWGMTKISNQELLELETRWVGPRSSRYARTAGNKLPYTEAEKSWLAQHDKIRIGIQMEWKPISYVDGQGQVFGMTPEFMDLVTERFAGKVEWVPGTWKNLLERLRSGDIDAMVDITATQARMPYYNFTSPYLTIPHVFVTAETAESPKAFADINGKTVALEEGYATVDYLRREFPEITVKTYPDTIDALLAVAHGEADVWVGNQAVAKYHLDVFQLELGKLKIGEPAPNWQSVLGIATRRDATVLRNIFEKGIIGITPAQAQKITDPWIKGAIDNAINLTPSEQRWITVNRDRPIRVLSDNWPPFNYTEGGEAKGLTISYMRHVFDVLGLEMEVVEMPWNKALAAISNLQSIDLIPDVAPSAEREKHVTFTKSYLSFPIVIFTRNEAEFITDLDNFNDRTVAVERGFITEDWIKKDYPNIKLLAADDTHEALKAVSLGQADAYVGNLAAGSYHIEKHGLSNLKVASPTSYPDHGLAVGVRRDWPELASLIDKVLAQMTDAEISELRNSALAIRYDYGADIKKILTYAIPAAGVIAIILVIIVIANRRLAREVGERRKAEERSLEREAWFKSLLESAPDATIIVNPDGQIVRVNRQAEILFAADREKLMGQSIETFVPDDVRPRHAAYRAGFVAASAPRSMGANAKLLARRMDGSLFPVEISLSPIETSQGTMIAAAVRDVSDRRAQEQELHDKDVQLTAALENMSGGMFMVDRGLNYVVFNRKYIEMHKLPEVRIGTPLRDVLYIRAVRGDYGPGDVDELVEARLQGYRECTVVQMEDHVPDGTIIESFRQKTADGGIVSVFNDITARKRIEESLDAQRKQLENLSTKLSRYLSPQIYEAIFAGAADTNVMTTRKKLTIFFSDIKDFTATTEEMEPEDMTYLLNDYLTKMTEIALEHGGTIDKYIGDAIMVFFGDPETKGVKEDALAAVRMAVAMQRRMVDLRAKWADMGYRLPFHIRCGINTGYVNVGNFGSEQRIDYTIIGGQVNLAARLESVCAPDGVTVSYETYSLIRDDFDAEELEPISVKGIHEPVTPFQIKGLFDTWNEQERYIRRDIRGMRLWVDLMRMNEEQRLQSIKELEEALDILKVKPAQSGDAAE